MNTSIYDKTDKGREEIATRRYQVPPKLRTLLVMIDGRQPLESLLKNFAALGVTQDAVNQLLKEEYIALVGGSRENEALTSALAAARAVKLARAHAAAARPIALHEAEPAVPPQQAGASDGTERWRAVYEFYNQTIKSTLGLRGFVLQLKVEKAASIDQLRALRRPYLEAVLKAKGREMALSLRDRLDQLSGGKPEVDDFFLPDE
jgi:hypothetical protein